MLPRARHFLLDTPRSCQGIAGERSTCSWVARDLDLCAFPQFREIPWAFQRLCSSGLMSGFDLANSCRALRYIQMQFLVS